MNKLISKTGKITISLLLILLSHVNAQEVEMADTMRSEGKIYVVILVAAMALTIVSIYMFRIDRKVSKLEKERKQ